MFTVKATYGAETRKFILQSDLFPTYDQLNQELSRVFPLSRSYYFSNISFTQDSSKPDCRIMFGQIRSQDDYNRLLSPLRCRVFPNALMRFFVFNDIPYFSPTSPFDARPLRPRSDPVANSLRGTIPPSFSPFGIPSPPPITLLSPSPFSESIGQTPPVTSPSITGATVGPKHRPQRDASPQRNPQRKQTPSVSSSCCSVSEGKQEIQRLVNSFKHDLERILADNFGSPPSGFATSSLPANPTQVKSSSLPSAVPHFKWFCVACIKPLHSSWLTCQQCAGHVLCHRCYAQGHGTTHQMGTGSAHAYQVSSCSCSDCLEALRAERFEPNSSQLSPNPINLGIPGFHPFGVSRLQPPLVSTYPPWGHSMAYPPMKPPVPMPGRPATPWEPFVPGCFPRDAPIGQSPRPSSPFVPCSSECPTPVSVASSRPPTPVLASTPVSSTTRPPLVHIGVTCDACEKTIVGVRHKCLDCFDYDLCTACIESGSTERHNPFHEFFGIEEPGRVIVHTVFSGDGERNAQSTRSRDDNTQDHTLSSPSKAHKAICDLCDSRIVGERYKCLNCPDFDTCASCFTITNEQHPLHGFVRIHKQADYIPRNKDSWVPRHNATCDACSKTIFGIRYKCMHPECPDFDLCANCEAHPIPMHPPNHPMLKMNIPDTLVPTVYRFGQTTATVPTPAVTNQTLPSPTRPYSRGYLHNPSVHSGTPLDMFCRDRADFHQQHSSPFSSREASRSPSPSRYRRIRKDLDSMESCQPMPEMAYGSPTTHEWLGYRSPGRRNYSPIIATARSMSPESRSSRSPRSAFSPPRELSPYPILGHLQSRSPSPPSIMLSPVAPILPMTDVTENAALGEQLEPTKVDSLTSSASGSQSKFKLPPLSLDPNRDLFFELWPRVTQELRHLMEHSQAVAQEATVDSVSTQAPSNHSMNSPETPGGRIGMESSLNGEALLKRPETASEGTDMLQVGETPVISVNRSLAALLNGYQPSPVPPSSLATWVKDVNKSREEPFPSSAQDFQSNSALLFLEYTTVPDGQVFPPGAEFVKSWCLLNNGEGEWPTSTQLVFAAGDPLVRDESTPKSVEIGAVTAGKCIEIRKEGLKAPDVPGRYVGYWRLSDGDNLFGPSIWIDITVVELNNRSESSSDESLASSSIVMPQCAPVKSSTLTELSEVTTQDRADPGSPATSSPVTVPSRPSSDNDSEADSVSLISIPTSEDDDQELWEDSRAYPPNEQSRAAMEYVVLYDDTSSDDE